VLSSSPHTASKCTAVLELCSQPTFVSSPTLLDSSRAPPQQVVHVLSSISQLLIETWAVLKAPTAAPPGPSWPKLRRSFLSVTSSACKADPVSSVA
jgi:hypothetical protein